jgi:hypothetical protein
MMQISSVSPIICYRLGSSYHAKGFCPERKSKVNELHQMTNTAEWDGSRPTTGIVSSSANDRVIGAAPFLPAF